MVLQQKKLLPSLKPHRLMFIKSVRLILRIQLNLKSLSGKRLLISLRVSKCYAIQKEPLNIKPVPIAKVFGESMAGFLHQNTETIFYSSKTGKTQMKDRSATTIPTKAFELNGITYLPHYVQKGYVYPGFSFRDSPISEKWLLKKGAKKVEAMLYSSYGRSQ